MSHNRSGNPAGPRLRNPQVLHLHPGPLDRDPNTQSGESPARLGMGNREADDEGGQGCKARCPPCKGCE